MFFIIHIPSSHVVDISHEHLLFASQSWHLIINGVGGIVVVEVEVGTVGGIVGTTVGGTGGTTVGGTGGTGASVVEVVVEVVVVVHWAQINELSLPSSKVLQPDKALE